MPKALFFTTGARWSAVGLTLLLFSLAVPQPARTQQQPKPLGAGEAAQKPTGRAKAILDAQNKLKEVAANCIEPDGQHFGPDCAIPLYHEAGEILRREKIDTAGAPDHWWAIYEGLGLAFGRLRRFEKAREFFLLAGRIEEVGLAPREETAYQLASLEILMGRPDRALQAFEILFQQNHKWIEEARKDPLLEKLRQGAAWEQMLDRLGVPAPK